MRPACVVVVLGTGTDVGKTWVTCALAGELRRAGFTVAARKPAQSFAQGEQTDADLLAAATGVTPVEVCPPHRWYEVAMAPPMAAQVLGRPRFMIADLVGELNWPQADAPVEVGLVEGAGGVRSPLADDGDAVDLLSALGPDHVVLVADATLGTLNLVRLSIDALAGWPLVVYLNRVDEADDLHRRNRHWIQARLGLEPVCTPGDLRDRLAANGGLRSRR